MHHRTATTPTRAAPSLPNDLCLLSTQSLNMDRLIALPEYKIPSFAKSCFEIALAITAFVLTCAAIIKCIFDPHAVVQYYISLGFTFLRVLVAAELAITGLPAQLGCSGPAYNLFLVLLFPIFLCCALVIFLTYFLYETKKQHPPLLSQWTDQSSRWRCIRSQLSVGRDNRFRASSKPFVGASSYWLSTMASTIYQRMLMGTSSLQRCRKRSRL